MNIKRIFYIFLSFVLIISVFCGCGGEEDMKTAPGTLVGIHYNRTNGSVANADFYIYVTPYNFVAEYMPENEDEWIYDEVTLGYVMTEKTGEVTKEQWKAIEETVLTVYPEIAPKEIKESFFKKLMKKFIVEPTILDGGDSTEFSAEWKTEEGIITENLYNPQGTNGYRFSLLLMEIADPMGREIPELEKNEQ